MSSDYSPQKPGRPSTADNQTTPKYASITGSIQEEEEDQDRPEASTSTSMHESTSEVRRDYGTLEPSDQGTVRYKAPASKRPTSPSERQNVPGSPAFVPLTPQTARSRPKPSTLRRASSKRPVPHRGEYFSVDDDPEEVEVDRDLIPRTPHSAAFAPLSRQNSTVRRRTHHNVPQLPRLESRSEDEVDAQPEELAEDDLVEEPEVFEEEEAVEDIPDDEDELSDTESFTLKDRQLAINETHPFGIRIWKPALYKKNRSVEKNAEEDIHSSPSEIVSRWLWTINCVWTIVFGWWLALAAFLAGTVCFLCAFEPSAPEYGRVFWGLADYLFWPFGKFVKLEQDENYAEEDQGEGRSISEYERWQSGDLEYGRLMFGPSMAHTGLVGRHRDSIDSASERDSLLGRNVRSEGSEQGANGRKKRLFGRGQWTLGRVVFFAIFYFLLAPLMLLVSLVCWLMVFWIPMGRVLLILFYHLRKRPLALTFHQDASYARDNTKPSSILLCTYRAAGLKYWKYTVDGTNIFLINFLAVVVFVIFDYFVLKGALQIDTWITSPALLFTLALVSIIPLAYFIGQAVASISAQSSMGMGAAVNAFFSTIVEVYLYCIALNEGKGKLVEGSIIGSIFAGILLLPGLSMCFGAIKRKTQRFNVKSAGATSTMLLFAMIGAFGPTLFYKIYGSHELICKTCTRDELEEPRDCRQCYFRQVPAVNDTFFVQAVRPYCWLAAVLLFVSYCVGLLFTLRTHAAVIWTTEIEEKKPVHGHSTTEVSPMDTRHQSAAASQLLNMSMSNGSAAHRTMVRESQLYKRILGQSLRSAGLESHDAITEEANHNMSKDSEQVDAVDHQTKTSLPHVVPPKSSGHDSNYNPKAHPVVPGLSEEDNHNLVRQVAEIAATAATVAARDAVEHPRRASYQATHAPPPSKHDKSRPSTLRVHTAADVGPVTGPPSVTGGAIAPEAAAGGHDAPNWSRQKSSIILMVATVAYAIVAEVLVNTVDVVLSSVDIDEKFLGITLFALVPNTTEFLNAISFAMNGNIALSMEIGSAYALQVALLQIPALVLFSAVHGRYIDPQDLIDHTFNLIFPQWDMVTVILCVFLLSYMYTEGKSNYFKGSILVMTYLVVIMGFYFSSFTSMDILGVDPGNTLAISINHWDSFQSASTRGGGLSKKSEL